MNTPKQNSPKLKSSKKASTASNKPRRAKNATKDSLNTFDKISHLDILNDETWEYMNEVGDLRYET